MAARTVTAKRKIPKRFTNTSEGADIIGYTNATAEISGGMEVCQRCREYGGWLT